MWPFKKKNGKAKAPDPVEVLSEKLDAISDKLAALSKLGSLRSLHLHRKVTAIEKAVDVVGKELAVESESVREAIRARQTIKCKLMLGTPESFSRELASIRDEIHALSVSDR